MFRIYQTTLEKAAKFEGVGLHSGKNTEINILPADADTGILFKRIDLKENNSVKANYLNVTSTKLCTTLENNFGVKISTVEHLLAALFIANIDNAIVEINNQEVPIMDGSSRDFLDVLKKVNIKILKEKKDYIKILKKIELVDGERKISIEPLNSFEVDFQLNYNNKMIGKQKNTINFNKDNLDDVVSSRTFCLYSDIEKIKKLGLAKGGNLKNAIVVDENKILNKDGLRNKKEVVNHKILDLAGDFYLSTNEIIGKVVCNQGGHELSNKFLRKLLNSKNYFEKINLSEIIKIEGSLINTPLKAAVNA